jgi:hypothetical protein
MNDSTLLNEKHRNIAEHIRRVWAGGGVVIVTSWKDDPSAQRVKNPGVRFYTDTGPPEKIGDDVQLLLSANSKKDRNLGKVRRLRPNLLKYSLTRPLIARILAYAVNVSPSKTEGAEGVPDVVSGTPQPERRQEPMAETKEQKFAAAFRSEPGIPGQDGWITNRSLVRVIGALKKTGTFKASVTPQTLKRDLWVIATGARSDSTKMTRYHLGLAIERPGVVPEPVIVPPSNYYEAAKLLIGTEAVARERLAGLEKAKLAEQARHDAAVAKLCEEEDVAQAEISRIEVAKKLVEGIDELMAPKLAP